MLKTPTTASCLEQVMKKCHIFIRSAVFIQLFLGPLEYLATPAPAADVRIETGVRQSDQVWPMLWRLCCPTDPFEFGA